MKSHASQNKLVYSFGYQSRQAIVLGDEFNSGGIKFYTKNPTVESVGSIFSDSPTMLIADDGKVGIGTSTPDPESKLTVAGKIHSREVKVTTNAGADFVFEDDYKLRSLAETESFIKANKHLPEIAPAETMKKEGIDLGEMNIKLLQKIEELTLHLISLKKEVDLVTKSNKDLLNEVQRLKQKP